MKFVKSREKSVHRALLIFLHEVTGAYKFDFD